MVRQFFLPVMYSFEVTTGVKETHCLHSDQNNILVQNIKKNLTNRRYPKHGRILLCIDLALQRLVAKFFTHIVLFRYFN